MNQLKNYIVEIESMEQSFVKEAEAQIRESIIQDGLNPEYACISFNNINVPGIEGENGLITEAKSVYFISAFALVN